jgi:nitrile hydratase accessory protein
MIESSPSDLAGLPRDSHGPVFNQPWEAKAFAMVLRLHERGLFTWTEWADALSQEIRDAPARGDADLGDTYYQHWLRALETMVARKSATSAEELARYQHAWAKAAERTPHGQAVELSSGDVLNLEGAANS